MNSGDILSLGDAIIDNANGGQTRAVTNMGGHIESLGNMTIRAEKIATSATLKHAILMMIRNRFGIHQPQVKKACDSKIKMITADSGHSLAVIQSGGNMLLDGNVTNKVSLLAAKDALHITGDLNNQGIDLRLMLMLRPITGTWWAVNLVVTVMRPSSEPSNEPNIIRVGCSFDASERSPMWCMRMWHGTVMTPFMIG